VNGSIVVVSSSSSSSIDAEDEGEDDDEDERLVVSALSAQREVSIEVKGAETMRNGLA
jgi:hypothetical protein